MSLKAFHILFVSLSALICMVLGVWGTIFQERSAESLALGVLGYTGALVLILYGVRVFRKLRAL